MAALPGYDEIREYVLNGKWTERMLKTALTCKQITQEQFNSIMAEKAAQKKD